MNGAWPHDTLPSANNGFPPQDATFDPQMLNASNPQFNNPQFQQPRSQTPSQFPYTPQQLVPSKRPRPSDDGAVASPRQPPSNISLSRSQTPQQVPNSYPGGAFPNNSQGQPIQPPNAFQHLQHGGSNNATPSPTLSNSNYRPPGQQPGMGMSPPPDGSGRGTPQNPQFNMNGQMPGAQMGGQMGQQMPGQGFNGMPGSMPPNFNQQNFAGMQQMGGQGQQYQAVQLPPHLAQRQAQIQMNQRMAQAQRQGQMNPAMMQPAAAQQQGNMGTPTRPPQQGGMPNMAAQQQRQLEERAFLEKITKYMQQTGRPFDPTPMIAGRPISLYALFHTVLRAQSSKVVTQRQLWPQVARSLGLPPEQYPNGGMEMQQLFERNLGQWEAAYHNQRVQAQQMKQAQMAGQMPPGPGQQNMSPGRPMPQTPQQNNNAATQQYMAQLQQRMGGMPPQQSPMPGQMTPQQNNAQLPQQNGWSTPQSDPSRARPPSVEQHRKSASQQLDGSPAPNKMGNFATPPAGRGMPPRSDSKGVNGVETIQVNESEDQTKYTPRKSLPHPLGTPFQFVDSLDSFQEQLAPLNLHHVDIPSRIDRGNVDIHAVTLSLQSGLGAEVRYALDMLNKLTARDDKEPRFETYIELAAAADLLDVLVDCGEDQVEILRDDSRRIEGLEPASYEELIRLAKLEAMDLQEIPEDGSDKYNKARAAERLVAVTSLLRNLSFPRPNPQEVVVPPELRLPQPNIPENRTILAHSRAIKFLSNTIGMLATRVINLQTSVNAQDFMKDVIVFLSNTAAEVTLESQDDAYNFLQFILAFAPGPIPTETDPFRFALYKPAVHKYYPTAIDAFAKLLAKDDPNRTFFRQIFVDVADHEDSEDTDFPVHQQYDLLTRAFGMAIAVIPDLSGHDRKPLNRMEDEILTIARARKATLEQGILAADILSTLIPPSDPGLAKAWLKSQDSWGSMLFRVITELAESDGEKEVVTRNQYGGHLPQNLYQEDRYLVQVFVSTVSRAMSMLKRLARKALEDSSAPVPKKPEEAPEHEEGKVNGVDHSSEDGVEEPSKELEANGDDLLDDLADMEKSTATDFLPLSESIFYGIFANTKELASGVIADYIALGEILQ